MTKKHFIELADMVRDHKPIAQGNPHVDEAVNRGMHMQYEIMRDMLADFCRSQNPRFNRQRWLAYIAGECGPSGGQIKQTKERAA